MFWTSKWVTASNKTSKSSMEFPVADQINEQTCSRKWQKRRSHGALTATIWDELRGDKLRWIKVRGWCAIWSCGSTTQIAPPPAGPCHRTATGPVRSLWGNPDKDRCGGLTSRDPSLASNCVSRRLSLSARLTSVTTVLGSHAAFAARLIQILSLAWHRPKI